MSNNQIAVDNLLARKSNLDTTILQHQQLPQNIFSTATRKLNQQQITQTQQSIPQQQQVGTSRIISHPNLIAVSTVGNQTQLINLQPQSDNTYQQQQQQIPQQQQQQIQNVRVTMSALASQLASPPAIMTTPIQQTTTQQYATFPQKQQILINNRTILHRENSVTSPGSDSNASSSSNIGYSMSGLNALLASSPSPVSIDFNTTNSNNSALIERLTSPSTVSVGGQFTAPSPKNISIQQQHIQVQSPSSSMSPLSSPPPQQQQQQSQNQTIQTQPQTTTLNLQGLNLASLQGAMATIPGLQNVQVNFKFIFILLCCFSSINIVIRTAINLPLCD